MENKQNYKQAKLRIAAIGDIHVKEGMHDAYKDLFAEISGQADVLALAGDLCDHGYAQEAEILAENLRSCRIPVVGVLGNHDHANGEQEKIKEILSQTGMTMLENGPTVIQDVGFAGVKGFSGGFDQLILGPFGEPIVKEFVQAVIDEQLALETQLSEMHTQKKVVVMHFSPIRQTVVGEPEEIFPFLGCSRLAEPIDRYNATMVFHGHAHYGTYKGKTIKEIPVYNVSKNVVTKAIGKSYGIFEV